MSSRALIMMGWEALSRAAEGGFCPPGTSSVHRSFKKLRLPLGIYGFNRSMAATAEVAMVRLNLD